jgi:hypothetical protein
MHWLRLRKRKSSCVHGRLGWIAASVSTAQLLRGMAESREDTMPEPYKEDPLITQAAIAYINWRVAGGQGDWEPYKRQWLIDHEASERIANERKATDGRAQG